MSKKEEKNLQQAWAQSLIKDKAPNAALYCLLTRVRSAHDALTRFGEVDDDHWNDLWERSLTWLNEAMIIGEAIGDQNLNQVRITLNDSGKDHDKMAREAMRKEFDDALRLVNAQTDK